MAKAGHPVGCPASLSAVAVFFGLPLLWPTGVHSATFFLEADIGCRSTPLPVGTVFGATSLPSHPHGLLGHGDEKHPPLDFSEIVRHRSQALWVLPCVYGDSTPVLDILY